MIWIADIIIFLSLMIWCFKYPRNEWMGNTIILLMSMFLALWYQPVLPIMLSNKDLATTQYPYHYILGLIIICSIGWAFMQQYEDLKQYIKEKRLLKKNKDL